MSTPSVRASSPGGVIHDIGYRPYSGSRSSEAAIARSLLTTSVSNAFGWSRSLQSKLLPLVLVVLYTLPAPIMVAVGVVTEQDLPWSYLEYTAGMWLLSSVFAAAQAPVLFSRDQRCGSIALYLSRPLRSFTYALMRWIGLWIALMIMMTLPLVVMLVGTVLSGRDVTDQLLGFAQAVVFGAVLMAMLAGITGVVSAWSTKRGFAVVISVAVLIIGSGIVSSLQAATAGQGSVGVGQAVAVLSPITLYQGVVSSLTDTSLSLLEQPGGATVGAFYLIVSGLLVALCLLLLRLHYRKVASR